MQRRVVFSVAIAAVFGSASAFAQDGDLSRMTMRVLDDLRDADAVVLELDANRAESEEGGESDGAARDAAPQEGDREAAPTERDDDARDLRRERAELHEDDDDRSEGRREDRDVERPVTPPAPTP
jgi:hypothetical protein